MTNRSSGWRCVSLLPVAALLALLASCGGGVVGAGGTGYTESGVAIGTVNGFGSVIVDGVSYGVQGAAVVREVAPGQESPSDVRLGQRVTIDYVTAGVASTVHVDAALAGVVSRVPAPGQFVVLGQTVTVNSSAAAGAITQLGGYGHVSDIHAGDAVEVHGVLVAQAASYAWAATRVDKLASAPAYLRVTGLVGNLVAGSFSLGSLGVDLGAAPVLPQNSTLANGQTVTVLALPQTLTAPAGPDGTRLTASEVRVRALSNNGLDDYVSGYVSHLDAAGHDFRLGSLTVDYASATLDPAAATLSNGEYVQVRGRVGADGTLQAAAITVKAGASGNDSDLAGTIVGYDATQNTFTVRDVLVDASAATLRGCPATGLASGLFVEVHGSMTITGVAATSVSCEDEGPQSTVEREGLAGTVDLSVQTFALTPEHGTAISVQWSATTYFENVTPQTLSSKSVEVEGVLTSGVLQAAKISADD